LAIQYVGDNRPLGSEPGLVGEVGSPWILSSPRKGSGFWQALDYDISDPGKYGGEIAARKAHEIVQHLRGATRNRDPLSATLVVSRREETDQRQSRPYCNPEGGSSSGKGRFRGRGEGVVKGGFVLLDEPKSCSLGCFAQVVVKGSQSQTGSLSQFQVRHVISSQTV
jgi:hypothetical protein